MSGRPLVIWRFLDGKPGHQQQTLGLVNAIAKLKPVDVIEFDLTQQSVGFTDWLLGRFPLGGICKRKPDLIVGAGHATHWAVLAAKKAVGGKAIVLMKPTIPASFFDLLVIPEHDNPAERSNVLVTRGVLNPMRPAEKIAGSLLILLGGESKHARWDNEHVLAQIEHILGAHNPELPWCITDSRRTPEAFSQQLNERFGARFMPWQDCPKGWLAERLSVTEKVWVSEDSVSMIYESLTAGCAVGLVTLPKEQSGGRLQRGIDALMEDQLVVSFSDWQLGQVLVTGGNHLAEADRVAERVLDLA